MTLVLQGHDLIKEYALKQANGEVEEEEEERPKERNIERPKKGRSFNSKILQSVKASKLSFIFKIVLINKSYIFLLLFCLTT